jgi:hypothetical protein
MDGTTEQKNHIMNGGLVNHEDNRLKKRIISSPAIILSDSSVPLHNGTNSFDEDEPFLKLTSTKNHVHFLLGLDEGSDDYQSEDIQIDTTLNEPYRDRSDALLSMAHILDTNKPWSKHNHHTIPV